MSERAGERVVAGMDGRPAHRPPARFSTATVLGIVLVAAGLLVWLIAALESHREARSYTGSEPPAAFVAVTAGHTYSISIPRGLDAARRVTDVRSLPCAITPRGSGPSSLQIQPETNDKAINQIASFVAPVSGDVHVSCTGLGSVYVDDADGQADRAGQLVLLTTLLLTIGVPVLLSGLAAGRRRSAAERWPAGLDASAV